MLSSVVGSKDEILNTVMHIISRLSQLARRKVILSVPTCEKEGMTQFVFILASVLSHTVITVMYLMM